MQRLNYDFNGYTLSPVNFSSRSEISDNCSSVKLLVPRVSLGTSSGQWHDSIFDKWTSKLTKQTISNVKFKYRDSRMIFWLLTDSLVVCWVLSSVCLSLISNCHKVTTLCFNPFYFCNNFVEPGPIWIIFGRYVANEFSSELQVLGYHAGLSVSDTDT